MTAPAHNTHQATTGRCGETALTLLKGPTPPCALPAGHDGWHRADNGMEWGPRNRCTATDHTGCTPGLCGDAAAAMFDNRLVAAEERDRLVLALAEILSRFGYRRQVGNVPYLRTGWIGEDDINRWRRTLHDNAGHLATPRGEPEGEPLPGAVPVTPDEMIDLVGAALGLAQRQTVEQAARVDRLRDVNDTLALTLAEALGTLAPDGGGCSRGWIPAATVDRWRRAFHDAEQARAALGSAPARAQDPDGIAGRLADALDTWAQDWHRRREHGATPAQPADAALLAAYDAHQAATRDGAA